MPFLKGEVARLDAEVRCYLRTGHFRMPDCIKG